MSEFPDQMPLFEPDNPRPKGARTRTEPDPARVTWRRVTRPHEPCDRCMAYTVENPRTAPYARRARYIRKGGGIEQWLCLWHANEERDRDRLTRYKE